MVWNSRLAERRCCLAAIVCIGVAMLGSSVPGQELDPLAAAKTKTWKPIDIGPFGDAISHALMKYKDKTAPYARYTPEQVVHIAKNLLAYQNGDGGWPKNVDWLRIVPAEELAGLPHGTAGKMGAKSTLDNSNTWSQIAYLAQVYRQTELKILAEAALKAIAYMIAEQRSSGGWCGADVDAITFNDQVMAGVLRVLKTIVEDKTLYGFVDDARRASCRDAYDKGIRCILDCQIKVQGRLTAWCQQHDHKDLKAVGARTYERPSITPGESTGVVRLLMEIDNPSPEVVMAIQSAVAWFDKVKITGLRIEKAPAPPMQFKYSFNDFDYVEVKDAKAPPIWARYYDLETEAPFFCNRDGKTTLRYSDLERERRTGYAWYGHWPAALLNKDYPAWQKKWAPNDNVLSHQRGGTEGTMR